jgi:uncharacterized spore protein YtfJ
MSVTQIEAIVERLTRSANARSVFGDPIERGDRTVVPVARVGYGFGGGYGRSGSTDESAADEQGEGGAGQGGEGGAGQGGGGGGGSLARPVGALEITDERTRFVRFGGRTRSLALLLVGFALGVTFGRRSDAEA